MTQALAKAPSRQQSLKHTLDKVAPSLLKVIPKHVTPDRLIKVALSACARQPQLLECSEMSIVRAIMQGAELGLEVGGLLGEAYMVPYHNSQKGEKEAQFIVGYKGLIKLARQSGQIASMEAHIVHKNDFFDLEYGLVPKLVHRVDLTKEPGEMIAAYAVARFVAGGTQHEVMTKGEIDQIRNRSRAGSSGPWKSDYEEMAKKTVLRRLCKFLPLSPELARAASHGETDEESDDELPEDIVRALQDNGSAPIPLSSAQKAKQALKGNRPAVQSAPVYDTVTGELPMDDSPPEPPPIREPGEDGLCAVALMHTQMPALSPRPHWRHASQRVNPITTKIEVRKNDSNPEASGRSGRGIPQDNPGGASSVSRDARVPPGKSSGIGDYGECVAPTIRAGLPGVCCPQSANL